MHELNFQLQGDELNFQLQGVIQNLDGKCEKTWAVEALTPAFEFWAVVVSSALYTIPRFPHSSPSK